MIHTEDAQTMASELIPGTDAIRKILGPTAELIGEDLAKLYKVGRDRVINAAIRKVPDLDDGKRANLRVARDVLWHGAFTESDICSEYYGGLLAASRSTDGMDDTAIPFVNVIKSMSSEQIKAHYDIYWAYEKMRLDKNKKGKTLHIVHVIEKEDIYISSHINISIDLQVLRQQGLVASWEDGNHLVRHTGEDHKFILPYFMARPTLFGVTLYAAAHNKLEDWRTFGARELGALQDVEPPKFWGGSFDELIAAMGCEPAELTPRNTTR